jgi:rare lipoprotein A
MVKIASSGKPIRRPARPNLSTLDERQKMKSLALAPALLLALHFALPAPAAASGKSHLASDHGRNYSRSSRASSEPARSRLAASTDRIGTASYYQPGRLASGSRLNAGTLTAAHKTLPFGTRVRVRDLGSGRWVDVRINDRGPYIAGRIIDLSRAAAAVIGMTGRGIARVSMTVLGR